MPIADPLFTQRPFSSGAGEHPDGNGTATYAMVLSNEGGIRRPGFRNLYWPGLKKGVVHFRFKGATLIDPTNSTKLSLEVGVVTNTNVTGVTAHPTQKIRNLAVTAFDFSTSDGWCTGELPGPGHVPEAEQHREVAAHRHLRLRVLLARRSSLVGGRSRLYTGCVRRLVSCAW